MLDVALITGEEAELGPRGRALHNALERLGLRAAACSWSRPGDGRVAARLVVVCSMESRSGHLGPSLRWLTRTHQDTAVWNEPAVLRWGMHCGYLIDIAGRGLPTAPFEWVNSGTRVSIRRLAANRGWNELRLRSVSALEGPVAKRLRVDDGVKTEREFRRLTRHQAVLVQPFEPAEPVDSVSAIFVDDVVQAATGELSPEEASLAQRALDAIGRPIRYARVDLQRQPSAAISAVEVGDVERCLAPTPDAVGALAEALASAL